MIAADLSRVVVLLSLPVAYWLDLLALGHLYAIAILAGTAHVVFNTAYASFYVRLVSREQFLEANSKLSATRSISFMAGPAIGGVLVQWLTAPVAIVVDAALIPVLGDPGRPAEDPGGRARTGHRVAAASSSGGDGVPAPAPVPAGQPGLCDDGELLQPDGDGPADPLCQQELELSAGTIGIAFGIGASGGLLGAVAAAPLTRLIGAGRLIAIAAVVFPAAIGIAALASGPVWARAGALAAAEFIGAFAVMCFDIPLNAVQASVTHDTHAQPRGRRIQQHQLRRSADRRRRRRAAGDLDRGPGDAADLSGRRPAGRSMADPLAHHPGSRARGPATAGLIRAARIRHMPEASYETIRYELGDGVATITLNRPGHASMR